MSVTVPFNLQEGDYLYLSNGVFVGPLVQTVAGNLYWASEKAAAEWTKQGVPVGGSIPGFGPTRIQSVLKGPAGISRLLDQCRSVFRLHPTEFLQAQISNMEAALATFAPMKAIDPPAEEQGQKTQSAFVELEAMIARMIHDVVFPGLRQIVAEELEAIHDNQRRLLVTIEPA